MSIRDEFERTMADEAMLNWDESMQEYRSVVTQKMWITWQAARAQQGEGREAVGWVRPSIEKGGFSFTADPSLAQTWARVGKQVEPVYTHPAKAQGVPEGYVLAPKSMCITQEDVGLIVMMTGWDEEDQDDAEGVLWFGLIEDDDGNRTHGLNISCSECMEEGAIQLVQFDEPDTTPPSDKPEGEWVPNSEGPTSWEFRFVEALKLMCGGAEPSDRLVKEWLRHESEELQSWAANNTALHWSMGITTIEAAMALADEPDEGGEHYGDRPAAPDMGGEK